MGPIDDNLSHLDIKDAPSHLQQALAGHLKTQLDTVELPPVQKAAKMLELAPSLYFQTIEERDAFIMRPLHLAFDSLEHIAGEELLYLMTVYYLLSQLRKERKPACHLIWALF